MKKRVICNWKSSVIGLLFLIAAWVAFFLRIATLTEVAAFMPFCLGLIYVKDSIFKINSSGENNGEPSIKNHS